MITQINKAFLFLLVLVTVSSFAIADEPERFVALTIDDLPVVTRQKGIEVQRSITDRLLDHIRRSELPVTGFVNERKLFRDGARIADQIGFLRQWLESGCDLGNHTYSHLSLHNNSVSDYTAEILKGEIVTKELLAAKGMKMRYFRHPFLNTGLSLDVKAEVSSFLDKHAYEIAPVSIDTSDWAFAAAYDIAILNGDKKLKKRIGRAYVPYMEAKTAYWEKQSKKLFGREIRQILLLHANSINAEFLDDIAKMYRNRGYDFITIETALRDTAYRNPDNFTKRAGISWLHRWALDRGKEFIVPDEPRVPRFVMEAAGLKSE